MPTCPECRKTNPELGAKCPRCADSYYVYDEAVADGERDPFIGKKAAGKYVVVSEISEGGMGTVYKALQLPVDREVALKVLRADLEENEEIKKRFSREARAVAKIAHPNIIHLHDFGFDEAGHPFMVMEYAPGTNLDQWIYREEITLDRVLHVLRQILSALADAHQEGIVHRDLKPENIIVRGTGTDEDFIKLLDFGIARMVNEQATAGLTKEGEVFGTPHYMAPEQAEGKTEEIGLPVDVYAVGIMLYEMICAETPFDAPKPLSILFKQINEELPALEPRPGFDVPVWLNDLVRKAAAKDPEERFPDAGAMLEALEAESVEAIGAASDGQTLSGVGPSESKGVQVVPSDTDPDAPTPDPTGQTQLDGTPPPQPRDAQAGSNQVEVEDPDPTFEEIDDDLGRGGRTIATLLGALGVVVVGAAVAVLVWPSGSGSAGTTDQTANNPENASATPAAAAVTERADAGGAPDSTADTSTEDAGRDDGAAPTDVTGADTPPTAREEPTVRNEPTDESPSAGARPADGDDAPSDPTGLGVGSTGSTGASPPADSDPPPGNAATGEDRGAPSDDNAPADEITDSDGEMQLKKFGDPESVGSDEEEEDKTGTEPQKFGPPSE